MTGSTPWLKTFAAPCLLTRASRWIRVFMAFCFDIRSATFLFAILLRLNPPVISILRLLATLLGLHGASLLAGDKIVKYELR